jgi:hypothetical protein
MKVLQKKQFSPSFASLKSKQSDYLASIFLKVSINKDIIAIFQQS